ncbi:MAG: hypothetical protein COU81_01870 [Candidatus Portnoybacteria bacterium CG10_big_fil_rev_8_21_14_0_10_36_7]|uniref:Cell envelope-related transcriptional attenuator domain-containing protein n=1 Tax=Candidatus Portnoybacteria bacterium CG10_big_fil_rev_8_21_14_0_10_36_7 TaxID=1974812 RepID=A0A2M8KE79_9BACT|nr:MAG: hypothetical protein COU81_01870 [Candidatus Portnoybacteria bacterium CG10_big_fil_rev_8_21_14_0_10_36_7]
MNYRFKQFLLYIANGLLIVAIVFTTGKLLNTTRVFSQAGMNWSISGVLSTLSASVITTQSINDTVSDNDVQNILILGIAGPGNSAPNLTDTIILASLDKKHKTSSLISFPRDLWVKIPGKQYSTKLNSLYQMDMNNLSIIKSAIENISGQKINNYLRVNLSTTQEIIEKIGGATIDVKTDIYDSGYPGPNNSYETLSLKKGVQKLDGATAIKYMRTRNQDNDFERSARQQQVIKAVAEKVLSLNPVWHFITYFNILNTLHDNLYTDLSIFDLKNLWSAVYNIDPSNLATYTLNNTDQENLLKVSSRDLGENTASIVIPKAGENDYTEFHSFINNILKK